MLTAAGDPVQLRLARASGSLFELLGEIDPALRASRIDPAGTLRQR